MKKQLRNCHGNRDPKHVSVLVIKFCTQFVSGCRRGSLVRRKEGGREGGREGGGRARGGGRGGGREGGGRDRERVRKEGGNVYKTELHKGFSTLVSIASKLGRMDCTIVL